MRWMHLDCFILGTKKQGYEGRGGILNRALRPKLSFVCEKHCEDLNSGRYNSKAMRELFSCPDL